MIKKTMVSTLLVILILILGACDLQTETNDNKDVSSNTTKAATQVTANSSTAQEVEASTEESINYFDVINYGEINGITLADTKDSVISRFGDPDEVNEVEEFYGGNKLVLIYPDFEVACILDPNNNNSSESNPGIFYIRTTTGGIGSSNVKVNDDIREVLRHFNIQKDVDFNQTGVTVYVYDENNDSDFCRIDFSEVLGNGEMMFCSKNIYGFEITFKDYKVTELDLFEQN